MNRLSPSKSSAVEPALVPTQMKLMWAQSAFCPVLIAGCHPVSCPVRHEPGVYDAHPQRILLPLAGFLAGIPAKPHAAPGAILPAFELPWLLRHELGPHQCRAAPLVDALLGRWNRVYHRGNLLGKLLLCSGLFAGSGQPGNSEKRLAAVHDPPGKRAVRVCHHCGRQFGDGRVDAGIHPADRQLHSRAGAVFRVLPGKRPGG